MSDNTDDPVEFDCAECKRHIIQFCGPVDPYHLCATCISLPGWHEDPELRKRLDPGMDDLDE